MNKISDDTGRGGYEAEIARLINDEVATGSQRWARHQAITRLLRAAESIVVDDLLNDHEQWAPRLDKIRYFREAQAAEYDRLMASYRPAEAGQ